MTLFSVSGIAPRILAAALLVAAVPVVAATSVENIRVGRDSERTRVVLDLSADVKYELFRLSDPARVVIDVQDATAAPAVPVAEFMGSPVLRMSQSERGDGVLRLMLELDSDNYRIRDFGLRPNQEAGRGYRVVIDVLGSKVKLAEEPVGAPTPKESVTAPIASAVPPDPAPPPVAEAIAVEGVPPEEDSAPPQAPAAGSSSRPRPQSGVIVDFSGIWQHEWAYGTEASSSQKFESIVEPRWDVSFPGGIDVTAILRIRGDGVGDLGPTERRPPNYSNVSQPWFNSGEAEVSLRELFVDFRWGKTDWRLGKQQVVWGQADGFKVLDVVNPQSFREFILDDFDDSRIPLWTANVTLPMGDSASLQLLWIPDTTYHELAEQGTPFAFTTPRIIPQVPITALAEVDKPDNPFSDSDAGFALSGFVGGWDLSVNYLYRYLDVPVLPVRIRGPLLSRLEPEYRRSHLLGGTFSNAFGALMLRGELAYNSDTFQPTSTLANEAIAESEEFSSVLGLDWSLNMDTLLSVQWFNSLLFDHQESMGRDELEQQLTLLYQQDFSNATWRFRGIGIHSLNDGDTQLQLRLSYWWASELQLWLGADVFDGAARGLFGQFDAQDRVLVGFEYGF